MDYADINRFLELSKDEIIDKYGFVLNGRTWVLVKPSSQRRGSFWPVGGFRRIDIPSKFVKPGQTTLDGKEFNELDNFKLSQIGEICSRPRDPKNGKNVLYWVYGINSYRAIKNPCNFCQNLGNKACECDVHMRALMLDFEEAVRTNENNFYAPITPNLHREFNLRVASNYGKIASTEADKLTEAHTHGFFIPTEDIHIKDGNISAAEPATKSVKDALQSLFTFRDAPEDTFILPSDSYSLPFDRTVTPPIHSITHPDSPESDISDLSVNKLNIREEISKIDPHHPSLTPDDNRSLLKT